MPDDVSTPIEGAVAPAAAGSNPLVRYLASLSPGRLALWCYFIWYLVVLVRYFDPSPQIWLTSVGLSVIIGFALLINSRSGSRRIPLEPWPTFRLFLTPFCVSSFSALVKGHHFILLFSPHVGELLTTLTLCVILCGATVVCKRLYPAHANDKLSREWD